MVVNGWIHESNRQVSESREHEARLDIATRRRLISLFFFVLFSFITSATGVICMAFWILCSEIILKTSVFHRCIVMNKAFIIFGNIMVMSLIVIIIKQFSAAEPSYDNVHFVPVSTYINLDLSDKGQLIDPFTSQMSSVDLKSDLSKSISVIIPSRNEGMLLIHTLGYLFNTTLISAKLKPSSTTTKPESISRNVTFLNNKFKTDDFPFIYEVIVIDDASAIPEEDFILEHIPSNFIPKIVVTRLNSQQGLTRAKLIGANMASGKYLFFLDAHCRVMEGWAESLINAANDSTLTFSISENQQKFSQFAHKDDFPLLRFVLPRIVALEDPSNWQIGFGAVGGSMAIKNWGLDVHWIDSELYTNEIENLTLKDNNNRIQSNISPAPIMPGGIFLVEKNLFDAIGAYDPQMLGWGGENIELSFRVWLCGGEIVVAHNALVGHVFKPSNDEIIKERLLGLHSNLWRTGYTWLDDGYFDLLHSHYFWKRSNRGVNEVEPGNRQGLESRIALRRSMNCLNFSKYVERFKGAFELAGMLDTGFMHLRETTSGLCLSGVSSKDGQSSRYSVSMKTCATDEPDQRWGVINGGRSLFNEGANRCLDLGGEFPDTISARYKALILDSNKRQNELEVRKNDYEFEGLLLYSCDWRGLRNVNGHRNLNQIWLYDRLEMPGHSLSIPLEAMGAIKTSDLALTLNKFDSLLTEASDRHVGINGTGLIVSMKDLDWASHVLDGLDYYGLSGGVPPMSKEGTWLGRRAAGDSHAACLGVRRRDGLVVVGVCEDTDLGRHFESIWVRRKV